jgi:hypothetical protein
VSEEDPTDAAALRNWLCIPEVAGFPLAVMKLKEDQNIDGARKYAYSE